MFRQHNITHFESEPGVGVVDEDCTALDAGEVTPTADFYESGCNKQRLDFIRHPCAKLDRS